MIHVIAHITTKPGMRGAVLEVFKRNVPNVHAEAGCIEYVPVVDAVGFEAVATPAGADTFVVVEKWETLDHLKAHAVAPHMKAYAEEVKDMLADRKIYVLEGA